MDPQQAPADPQQTPRPPRMPTPRVSIRLESDSDESGLYSAQQQQPWWRGGLHPPSELPPPETPRDRYRNLHPHFRDSCAETVLWMHLGPVPALRGPWNNVEVLKLLLNWVKFEDDRLFKMTESLKKTNFWLSKFKFISSQFKKKNLTHILAKIFFLFWTFSSLWKLMNFICKFSRKQLFIYMTEFFFEYRFSRKLKLTWHTF